MNREFWVVTGTSRGIGLGITQAALLDCSEVSLLCGFYPEHGEEKELPKLKEAFGDRLKTHQLDISKDESVAAFGQWVKTQLGSNGYVSTLINNAGICPEKSTSVEDVKAATILNTISTNSLGPLRMTQAILPFLRAPGGAAPAAAAKEEVKEEEEEQEQEEEEDGGKKKGGKKRGASASAAAPKKKGRTAKGQKAGGAAAAAEGGGGGSGKKGPIVLNISSRQGSVSMARGAMKIYARTFGYKMSKAALNMFALALSVDHPELVCVCLHPGYVDTALTDFKGTVSIDEAGGKIVRIAKNLTLDDTGRFIDADGKNLSW